MKRCAVCGDPVPVGEKRIPHKKYCSPTCARWGRDFNMRARRVLAIRLLRFMERETPEALRKIAAAMDAWEINGRDRKTRAISDGGRQDQGAAAI